MTTFHDNRSSAIRHMSQALAPVIKKTLGNVYHTNAHVLAYQRALAYQFSYTRSCIETQSINRSVTPGNKSCADVEFPLEK